jgi:hypothetical protein
MNPTIRNLLHNLRAEIANGLAALPGERPEWLVLEMSGPYPMRTPRRKLTGFPPPLGPLPESVESFEKLDRLTKAFPTAPIYAFEPVEAAFRVST